MIRLIPLGFAVYALASFVLLKRAPSDVRVDLAQPLVVVTYWQHFGAAICLTLFAGLAIASVGYVRALQKQPDRKSIWLVCAIACACGVAAPAIFSSDVYAYAAYGEMAARGINPYVHAHLAVRSPLLDAAQWQWGNPLPACVYGPLFVLLAIVCDAVQPLGPAAPLWLLRILACGALVGCARFAPARVAAVVALNPLAIWSCVEGHNDIFAIALALGGFALSSRRRFAGSFMAVFSAACKIPSLAAAVFVRSRRGAIAAAASCVLLYLPLIAGALHATGGGTFAPHFSLMYVFARSMPMPAAVLLTLVCAAIVALRGRDAAHATLALWLLVPNPYPWYGIWLLPIAAACEDSYERAALVAASLLCALRYYGEATSALTPAIEGAIVLCAYGIPVLIMGTARLRSGRPASRTPGLGLAPGRFP